MTASPGQTARGYQHPANTQFSVFLDNRVGRLLDLIEVFRGSGAELAALSVVDATDHSVVRMVTTNAAIARGLLAARGLPGSEAMVLVVALTNQHDLGDLCRCLVGAELSIHYAYPLLASAPGRRAIVIHTDDEHLAGQILLRKGFVLLAEADLLGPGPT